MYYHNNRLKTKLCSLALRLIYKAFVFPFLSLVETYYITEIMYYEIGFGQIESCILFIFSCGHATP